MNYDLSVSALGLLERRLKYFQTKDKPEILFYEGSRSDILFEPDYDSPCFDQQFIRSKLECNSRFLKTGCFSRYTFNKEYIRAATLQESYEYFRLKENSKHNKS